MSDLFSSEKSLSQQERQLWIENVNMDYEENMENARYVTNDETPFVYEPEIESSCDAKVTF